MDVLGWSSFVLELFDFCFASVGFFEDVVLRFAFVDAAFVLLLVPFSLLLSFLFLDVVLCFAFVAVDVFFRSCESDATRAGSVTRMRWPAATLVFML